MGAPAKYLFDVDFAASAGSKQAGSTISLAEHALKLAEAETAAHRRGYADAQADAKIEYDRRVADAVPSAELEQHLGLGHRARTFGGLAAARGARERQGSVVSFKLEQRA